MIKFPGLATVFVIELSQLRKAVGRLRAVEGHRVSNSCLCRNRIYILTFVPFISCRNLSAYQGR